MKFKIIDESKCSLQALEKIHEDSAYTYFLPSMKSSQIFLEFENGQRISLAKALKNGMASVDSLKQGGLKILTNPK